MLTWAQFLVLWLWSARTPWVPSVPPCLFEPFSSVHLSFPALSLLRPPASLELSLSKQAATQDRVVFVWCRYIPMFKFLTYSRRWMWIPGLFVRCVSVSPHPVSCWVLLISSPGVVETPTQSSSPFTYTREEQSVRHVGMLVTNIFPICAIAKMPLNKTSVSSLLSWRCSVTRC